MNSNDVQQIILPLRICKKCRSIDVRLAKSSNWDECLIVHCTACENQWYICTKHSKKFSSKCYKQMNRHFSIFHDLVENNILNSISDLPSRTVVSSLLKIVDLREDRNYTSEKYIYKRFL